MPNKATIEGYVRVIQSEWRSMIVLFNENGPLPEITITREPNSGIMGSNPLQFTQPEWGDQQKVRITIEVEPETKVEKPDFLEGLNGEEVELLRRLRTLFIVNRSDKVPSGPMVDSYGQPRQTSAKAIHDVVMQSKVTVNEGAQLRAKSVEEEIERLGRIGSRGYQR